MSSDDDDSPSQVSASVSPSSPLSAGAESDVAESDVADSEPEPSPESEPIAESIASASSAEPQSDSETEGGGSNADSEPRLAESAGLAESASGDNSANASVSNADADSEADVDARGDATTTAASASQATTEKARVETFGTAFGTLEEHIASHNYPAHVATCGPCHFWKNRRQWSAEFSYINPVSQKTETWLGCKDGFAICLVCSVSKGGKSRSQLGKGLGSFLRKVNIQRHAICAEHTSSLLEWRERLLAEATGVQTVSQSANERLLFEAIGSQTGSQCATSASLAASATLASARTPQSTGYRAIVATRALLETAGSFRSFDVWIEALAGEERQALESHWHCKRLVRTMASQEKEITRRILRDGSIFRLEADGLDRTYQVEIGTVLWSLPSSLKQLPAHGVQSGWLEVLGPQGPWIVERIIGMQEFPQSMDVDGKVGMLESCVRRACVSLNGELEVKLHQHVREQTRVWCSDGADLNVPLAASAFFPGLRFHAWDEAHSAQRLLANSMKDCDEILVTDKLLVTGKKPYSLAKFLSTSMVFRKTVGDAQLADEIAFVKNFGWAPQRFNSRARPYARESRRWKIIFDAVAVEAAGSDKNRRILARMYLGELGGEHSSRLLLGGLLADLSAEHYKWVATGDKRNPDTTTVQSRADAFLERLHKLFNEGLIVTLPDTYTGLTLKFLSKTSYYRCGNTVQTIGIGDWTKDESSRNIIKEAMRQMQVLVGNSFLFLIHRSRDVHAPHSPSCSQHRDVFLKPMGMFRNRMASKEI